MAKEQAKRWIESVRKGKEVPARDFPGHSLDGGFLRCDCTTGNFYLSGRQIGRQQALRIMRLTCRRIKESR
jgi:hypothetical protein